MNLNFNMTDLKFSVSPTHCNKMTWEGCITKLGSPSDGAPGGANGHRVVITQEAGFANHKTFEGMPLNCTFGEGFFGSGEDVFTGHGDLIIGYIEKSWVDGDELMASGYIWKNNFPEVAFQTINAKNSLGFSVEMFCDEVEFGKEDDFAYIKGFTGVGCAMLFSECAAFGETYIKELVAKRMKGEVESMNKEELQIAITAAVEAVANTLAENFVAKFSALEDAIANLDGKLEAQKEAVVTEEVEALKAENEALKAEKETLEQSVTEVTAAKEALEAEKADLELKLQGEPQRKTAENIGAILTKFGKETEKSSDRIGIGAGIKAGIAKAMGKE